VRRTGLLAYFAAVAEAGVSIVTLVALGLAPLLIAVGATVLGHGRPDAATVVALGVALVGLVLLVGISAGADTVTTVVLGALLAVGSALGYAVVTLAGAGAPEGVPVTLGGFAGGALLLTPAALAVGMRFTTDPVALGCGSTWARSRARWPTGCSSPGSAACRARWPDRDAARTADRDRAGDAGRAALLRRAGRRSPRASRRLGALPAEDGRFELPRGCPQPAFQASAIGH
jgi:hypothetical protein